MAFGTPSVASWSGDDATATNPTIKYSVGGTVSGLFGSLVLQDNAGDDLTVSSDGSFEFQTPLADGSAYHVTITSSPTQQTCTIANANGTISSASVTNLLVTCTSPPAGMQVQFEGSDANGVASYAFTSPMMEVAPSF